MTRDDQGEPSHDPSAPSDPASAQTTGLLWANAEWLRGDAPDGDVVLSSRVRLGRNLAGFRFAPKATTRDRLLVLDIVRDALERGGVLSGSGTEPSELTLGERLIWVDLHRTDQAVRDLLVERHVISRDLGKQRKKLDEPRAVAISVPSERTSVMVNEEDHVRIQSLHPGFALGEAMNDANTIDDIIEQSVDYAFSPRWGYLTACPTNLGTGIRISVMLHLPGLKLLGDIAKVQRAAEDMSLAVRGFWGEGSETEGDFYQISNQTTLGRSEAVILEEFRREILPAVIEYERVARKQLVEKRTDHLADTVYRALGQLTHARLLATGEAMQLLSRVRLGLVSGVLKPDAAQAPGLSLQTVHALLLLVHSAHLARSVGRDLTTDERKGARATLVRRRLLSQDLA